MIQIIILLSSQSLGIIFCILITLHSKWMMECSIDHQHHHYAAAEFTQPLDIEPMIASTPVFLSNPRPIISSTSPTIHKWVAVQIYCMCESLFLRGVNFWSACHSRMLQIFGFGPFRVWVDFGRGRPRRRMLRKLCPRRSREVRGGKGAASGQFLLAKFFFAHFSI